MDEGVTFGREAGCERVWLTGSAGAGRASRTSTGDPSSGASVKAAAQPVSQALGTAACSMRSSAEIFSSSSAAARNRGVPGHEAPAISLASSNPIRRRSLTPTAEPMLYHEVIAWQIMTYVLTLVMSFLRHGPTRTDSQNRVSAFPERRSIRVNGPSNLSAGVP